MTDSSAILKRIISERRSVREFLNKPVPKELLLEVINAGRLSPSPTNSQPWYFLILSGNDTKKASQIISQEAEDLEIAGYKEIALDSARIIANAPHVITVWNMKYNSNRLKRLKDLIGEDYYRNYEIAEIACIGCAVENMWLTAQSLGLGMVWLMASRKSYEECSKEFGIDGNIIAYIPIGYPSEGAFGTSALHTQRKSIEEVCSFYNSQDTNES